jgi:hypothetical protein
MFFLAGALICWDSKPQSVAATSSTIAEFIAFDAATKQAIWLTKLIKEIDLPIETSIEIRIDSQNALGILKRPNWAPSLRWIDTRYYFVKEAIENGIVKFTYVCLDNIIADNLTKTFAVQKHQKFVEQLGLNIKIKIKN